MAIGALLSLIYRGRSILRGKVRCELPHNRSCLMQIMECVHAKGE